MMNISERLSAEELERLLGSEDEQEVIEALMYSVFNIDDPEWVQEKCRNLICSENSLNVRGLAVTCLGHVARMHKKINRSLTAPLLMELAKNQDLSGRASDALDDIEQFVKNE